jgi:hypothetical protein
MPAAISRDTPARLAATLPGLSAAERSRADGIEADAIEEEEVIRLVGARLGRVIGHALARHIRQALASQLATDEEQRVELDALDAARGVSPPATVV